MPELPDVVVYVQSLGRLLAGQTVDDVIIRSPSILKTFEPNIESICGLRIDGFSRCGKRVVWHLQDELFLVFHLMIAGRFHWSPKIKSPTGKNDLLAIQTPAGTMMLTEASSKKRAGLWILRSIDDVQCMSAGGVDVHRR